MGRGLGERQRQILDQLGQHAGYWVPLHELADDPDDRNEMAKARAAVRSLERRGLVDTERMADPRRRIETTSIYVELTGSLEGGLEDIYTAAPNSRTWFGLHVCRRDPPDPEDREPIPLDLEIGEL